MQNVNVLVMGATAVGKTALINTFLQEPFPAEYSSTLPNSRETLVSINNKFSKLQIYDFGASDRFPTMKYHYVKSSDAVLLVYSVTSKSSFERLTEIRQEILNIKGADIPMVLVGNKTDLENERRVSFEEGSNKALQFNCTFFETSAITQNSDVFKSLVENVLESRRENSAEISRQKKKCVVM